MDHEDIPVRSSRTIFLTVLCVLNFIGSVYLITNSISGIMSPESIDIVTNTISATFEEMDENMEDNAAAREMLSGMMLDIETNLVPYKYKSLNVFWLIGHTLIFLGTLFIWRLRKVGFHLYLGGVLVLLISTFYLFGAGITGWAFNFGNLFFGGLFTLFFALNLKQLK